jgi:hypothetical protein
MLRNSPNDWPMRGRRLAFCNEAGGFVIAFSDNSSISARQHVPLPIACKPGSRLTEGTRKIRPAAPLRRSRCGLGF